MWPFKKKIVNESKLPVPPPELGCIAKSIIKDLTELNFQEWSFEVEFLGGYFPQLYLIKHPKINYVITTFLHDSYPNEKKTLKLFNFNQTEFTQHEQTSIWNEINVIYKKQIVEKKKEELRLENIELAKIFPQCFKN
jgi:hypothetical protein